MNAFDVYINSEWVNRVFDSETDPNEVKRSLINHDGYCLSIEVKPAKGHMPNGRCWTDDEIRQGYRNGLSIL